MSLFQPRTDYYRTNNESQDIVHLGSHGCDALFTCYTAGTELNSLININSTRHVLISGSLKLTINNKTQVFHAGDRFEIPARTEHKLSYIQDCSLIEYWFDRKNKTA